MPYFITVPRVTVVIINWNYAAFIGQAIQSVKDQTYGNFACVIIDNGSSDNSVDVVTAAIAGDPRFTLHRLTENLGQLRAGFWALDHINGEFVTFLDADDVLFPAFLASHLQVHLASRSPAGFTTSDIVNADAAGMPLAGGYTALYRGWQLGEPCLMPPQRAIRIGAVDEAGYSELTHASRYLPGNLGGWNWSPGTSNMLRLSLMRRVCPTEMPAIVVNCLDMYFLSLLNAISGAIVIDLALSAYRIHGKNDVAGLPFLRDVRSQFSAATSNRASLDQGPFSLAILIDKFEDSPVPQSRIWIVLDNVAARHGGALSFDDPAVMSAIARQYPALVRFFGERTVLRELRARYNYKNVLAIAMASRKGTQRFTTRRRALSHELRRRLKF